MKQLLTRESLAGKRPGRGKEPRTRRRSPARHASGARLRDVGLRPDEPQDAPASDPGPGETRTRGSRWRGRGRTRPAEPDADGGFRSPIGQWTNGSNLKTKAATAGLVLALVLSPAGVVVGLAAASTGSAPTDQVTVADTRGEQAAVEEFASRFVVTWLSATSENADQVLAGLVDIPDAAEFPTTGLGASDPTIADVAQLDTGMWSVTIAVTTTSPGSDKGVRRFYAVPVVYDDGQLAALAMPALTAAPTMADTPTLTYDSDLTSDHPAWRTVSGFMTALLAGSGDITRYLTPGTQVAPVVPIPFSEVRIGEIATMSEPGVEPTRVPADGEELAVLVTAAGSTSPTEGGLTVQYALVLTGRDGRWEVTEVESSPHTDVEPADVTGELSDGGSPVEEEQ